MTDLTMMTRADSPRPLHAVKALAMALVLALSVGQPAMAQGLFSPAVRVNDRVVTNYEIQQRVQFLELLNAPGDLEQQARESLINERLQQDVGRRTGLLATPEAVDQGMEEFAGRTNMSTEAFLGAIQNEGIAPQTFRDFVSAGITWRNIVRTRFGPRAQVTEDEIDRALTMSTTEEGAQISVAELVVPLDAQNQDSLRTDLAQLAEQVDGSIGAFSEAARNYSASPTAARGGDLGWRPLSSIPPQLRAILLPMNVGDVTDPVPLGPAIAIFQLRGLQETGFVTPDVTALEYAQVLIPDGQSPEAQATAQDLRDSLDTCDDLYGVRPGGFERVSLPVGDVPGDVSLELAKLDANEVSTALTRNNGQDMLFLMLCGRSTELPEGGREEVRQALFQQRLQSYAEGYLAELRADAIIVETP
ncbi:peptidylprolyl isomerase [Nioella nitratireducens]|uniref:peptidylprolyl isomerase n=1 Tax=Nioella nitratireducens TaxID=1287720 RepID=UPI0009FD7BA2|nr:peptidylprolyl isomerase [Nioella nitratireducens]